MNKIIGLLVMVFMFLPWRPIIITPAQNRDSETQAKYKKLDFHVSKFILCLI